MVSKATKRKIETLWDNKCAVCEGMDFLEFHHLIPKENGGTDDYDNLILLCTRCHAAVHGRSYNPEKPNCKSSISYEAAQPILERYFANEIGASETKELLNLSQKTHLCESYVFKRYKREHQIENFYNNIDLINSKRRTHVPTVSDQI